MKYLILFLITFTQSIYANNFERVYNEIKSNKTSAYNLELETHTTYVKMEYGKSEAINLHYEDKFKHLDIYSITLIYSNYHEKGTISQIDLNKARLKSLYDYDSSLFNKDDIVWNSMAIEGIENLEEAKNTFHGFRISYYISDGSALDKVVNGSYSLADYMESTYTKASVYPKKDKSYTNTLDLAIYNTLERNKTWENMLIVTDLTGSMMPYSAQLIVWLKLNDKNKRAKSFIFLMMVIIKQTQIKLLVQLEEYILLKMKTLKK